MPIYDLTCKNNHEQLDVLLKIGERPACLICGEATETFWNGRSAGVVDDSIPGGIEIRHGICNEDGSPRRYYSHTDMKKEAAKRGLRNRVEHVTVPGSDKSPYTTKWTSTPSDVMKQVKKLKNE